MELNPQLLGMLTMLAQSKGLKVSPEQLAQVAQVAKAGLSAYRGNLDPAAQLLMGYLQERQPSLAAKVSTTAQSIVKQEENHKRAFFRRFTSQTYGIYLILGGRGTGKTALALRLAEILGRPTLAVGIPSDVLPEGIKETTIEELLQVPNYSVVIIDDASLFAHSSDARSPEMRILQDLINICRHVDITIIFTGQQAASLYKYTADADALFLKPAHLLYKVFERPEVIKYFDLAEEAFAQIPEHNKTLRLRSVFVIAPPDYVGLMEFDKPSGFTDTLSKNKRERSEVIDAEFKEITDRQPTS